MPVHRTSAITDNELYSWAQEHMDLYWAKTFDEVVRELIFYCHGLEDDLKKITRQNK
jgi:hypothetical protein